VKLRAHFGVYVICLALVALWTWPLARDPAHLVPDNTDPRLFSWVMISVFRNLLTRPHLLLHGSGFYPHGLSLTLAEPLVTPALVMGPLFWLTGNPYLAYNATLLLFWAASGWAMYAVTYWITRRHAAAAVAMLVFMLAPPRIGYAVEFQMEIMFGLPLCVYALLRYLESQRIRYLVTFVAAFWLQAIAVWYFAVILGLGLVVLAFAYALRRWSGWRPAALLAAVAGGVALAAALAPIAWPFFVTRSELSLERSIGDALDRAADALTYLTTKGTWLAKVVQVDFVSETTLFPGLVALALAALAPAWIRVDRGAGLSGGWPERLVSTAMAASLVIGVLTVHGGGRVGIGSAWTRLPSVTACGVVLLACLLFQSALVGWRRWRGGMRDRCLAPGEWVAILSAMGLFAFLLSLGPAVRIGGRQAGLGLYAGLHPYVLPLRAIRGTTRFGLLVLVVVALLAGLGMAWLLSRLPRSARWMVTVAALGALALDYRPAPHAYQWIAAYTRPVDRVLRADSDDVAVLEWPLNAPDVDVDAKLRTVGNGKRVINGFAGFVLDFQRDLSGILTSATPPFVSPAARTALAQIYPLRYLVVRDVTRKSDEGPTGQALADLSGGFLRFRGTHGPDDLYEIVPLPERGVLLERVVSYDLLLSRPLLRATLQPLRTRPGVEQWLSVRLNGTTVTRTALDTATTLAATLTGPLHRAAPNVIAFEHEYRRGAAALGPAHRLGAAGLAVPVDAIVRSAAQPYGDRASIQVGISDLAPNRRGYNLVALGPSGAVQDRVAFDTSGNPTASGQLTTWVKALPAGTIVLGAVKDEASGSLDGEAIEALATLGLRGDLRGRYRESHAFIGVKGAPPGSALEALGPRPVEVRVGEPDEVFGMELAEFQLEPSAPSR
jgi:interleukin-like EMT inducer protein